MSAIDRAAQFSPFAALAGHGTAIQETARLTEEFVELNEDRKAALDEKLRMIQENLEQMPEVTVTYFQPDLKKDGGAYVTVRGQVQKIDEYNRRVIFADHTVVPVERLCAIEGNLFGEMDLNS